MRLDDTFRFGKYKDRYLWEVMDLDVDYITWAIENLDLQLDNEAFIEYEKRL